ncbi:MAG: NAD-dependent epimerase/dehydratase family protein, partial [Bdellovibrionales bacterium]
MIVITGGTGFIGSFLAAKAEEHGERIVICDWLGCEDKWRNISKRDLQDLIAPEKLFDYLNANADEIEAVFHLGAISATTEKDGDAIAENNFRLSRDLWLWCQ